MWDAIKDSMRALRRWDESLDDRRNGPIRILFAVSNGHGFAGQMPIINALEGDERVRIQTTQAGSNSEMTFDDDAQARCYQKYFVDPRIAVFQKWNVIIHSDNHGLYFKRSAIHVFMNHGAAFGNTVANYTTMVTSGRYDVVFGLSEHWRDRIEQERPHFLSSGRRVFFSVGAPKLDKLAQGGYSREATLSELGLSPTRKTILIASHWTPASILRVWGARLLARVSGLEDRFNIIQTAHERLWTGPELDGFDREVVQNELQSMVREGNHVRVTRAVNILPLLNAADLLITDCSSVMVEFSSLDRPILFFDNPDYTFPDRRTYEMYLAASDRFTDIGDIDEKCLRGLADPDARRAGRRQLSGFFLAHSGTSAQAAKNALLSMGRVSGPDSAKWRSFATATAGAVSS